MTGIIRSSRIRQGGASEDAPELVERLAPVGRAHGLVAVLVQELDDAVADHLLVLDDEDPVSARSIDVCRLSIGVRGLDGGAQGQRDLEARAAVARVLGGDRAAVRVDDRLDQIEAEAQAAVVADRRGPLEALEDAVRARASGMPGPWSRTSSTTAPRLASRGRRPDRRARAVLDRVREQVGQRLLEAKPIPGADDRRRRSTTTARSAPGRRTGAARRRRRLTLSTSRTRSMASAKRPVAMRETSSSDSTRSAPGARCSARRAAASSPRAGRSRPCDRAACRAAAAAPSAASSARAPPATGTRRAAGSPPPPGQAELLLLPAGGARSDRGSPWRSRPARRSRCAAR